MTSASEENLIHAAIQGARIYFLRQDQSLSPTPADHALVPVVRISIRPAHLGDVLNSDPTIPAVDAIALIDTGAEAMYIDEDFAELHGFQSNELATVYGATGSTQQKVHPALFKLSDDTRHPTQGASFVSAPLRKNGRKYDVVIGMLLLSNGVLIMDFESNTFRFDFTRKPSA